MKISLVKRENASELVLTMMIWAVMSLLATRLYLQITGYPEVGRGQWHVAHVLFGGIVMLLGMLLSTIYHGERARKYSVVMFGIGLGWFLDETGKYLSRDNNYFFQPAIIVIYVFFILLFLLYRFLERTSPKDPKSLLYQIIIGLEEIAEGDLEKSEKTKMVERLDLLEIEDSGNKRLIGDLKKLVENSKSMADKPDSIVLKTWKWIKRVSYYQVFRKKWTQAVMAVIALGFTVSGIVESLILVWNFKQKDLVDFYLGKNLDSRADISLFNLKVGSDFLASIMFAVGIYCVSRRRPKMGIFYFQFGLLLNIFLASVARFYFEQYSAVFALFFTIIIYIGLGRLKKDLER